jgi:hypothetical protein
MVDHVARAGNLRDRASRCRSAGEEITSAKFEACYRKLADHYLALADLEEDFGRRTVMIRQDANENLMAKTIE